jgi:hypothetical protein
MLERITYARAHNLYPALQLLATYARAHNLCAALQFLAWSRGLVRLRASSIPVAYRLQAQRTSRLLVSKTR